jgi:hypothetical protein
VDRAAILAAPGGPSGPRACYGLGGRGC